MTSVPLPPPVCVPSRATGCRAKDRVSVCRGGLLGRKSRLPKGRRGPATNADAVATKSSSARSRRLAVPARSSGRLPLPPKVRGVRSYWSGLHRDHARASRARPTSLAIPAASGSRPPRHELLLQSQRCAVLTWLGPAGIALLEQFSGARTINSD